MQEVLDQWTKRGGSAYGVEEGGEGAGASAPLLTAAARAGFLTQLAMLTKRTVVVARREPLAYALRLIVNFMCTMFFGIIYIKTREREQGQVLSRSFFVLFCMGIPMQFILVAVYLYYHEYLTMKKEVLPPTLTLTLTLTLITSTSR